MSDQLDLYHQEQSPDSQLQGHVALEAQKIPPRATNLFPESESEIQDDSEEKRRKTRQIHKQKREKLRQGGKNRNGASQRRTPKRVKDEKDSAPMGRPSNVSVQSLHLRENKSYNDIVYHFCKFMIQMKMMEKEAQPAVVNLSNEDNQLMSLANEIMSADNFPEYDDPKPTFLLHPNSIHYLIKHQVETQQKRWYSAHEMLLNFKAFLHRRNMLTTQSETYLEEYWDDIIELVNNPVEQKMFTDRDPNDDDYNVRNEKMEGEGEPEQQNEQIHPGKAGKQKKGKGKAEGSKKGQKKPREIKESEALQKEVDEDESIVANEIACYLHACCQKYKIRIG